MKKFIDFELKSFFIKINTNNFFTTSIFLHVTLLTLVLAAKHYTIV